MTSVEEEEEEEERERERRDTRAAQPEHVARVQGTVVERRGAREAQGWAHAKTIDSTRLHAGNSILKAAATCPFSA